jgi:uncharacterized protein YjbI with pentapeptide repeats
MADPGHISNLRQFSVTEWREWRKKHPEIKIDLSGADLTGITLIGFDLSWSNLSGAKLANANLEGVNLHKALLVQAKLDRARLCKANLQLASLSGASLAGADLSRASLEEAVLQEANLEKTILAKAALSQAHIDKSNLAGVSAVEAHLNNATLTWSILVGAELKGADFAGSNLGYADLTRANLRGANLSEANLDNASLIEASLRGACFRDASLMETTGLHEEKFGNTDVTGAKLPPNIRPFESTKTVNELLSSSRNLLWIMLLACLFSWITIASTTDVQLVLNTAVLALPIIGTRIPLSGFYIVSPILLFGYYLYFLFNLQRLWEGLSKLPAVFPNGSRLDDKFSAWIFAIRVNKYFSVLRMKKPFLLRVQLFLSSVLIWCSIPFVLYLFWGRYLARQEIVPNILHSCLFSLSLMATVYFYFLSDFTLRYGPAGQRRNRDKRLLPFIGGTVAFAGLVTISILSSSMGIFIDKAVGHSLSHVGIFTRLNIRNADISNKPENWPEISRQSTAYDWVEGPDLSGRKFRNINAMSTFFAKANLGGADFSSAGLTLANFREAILNSADFKCAYLSSANFEGALIISGDFREAIAFGAIFKSSMLEGADFSSTDLKDADFTDACLDYANFIAAKHVNIDQLLKATSLIQASFDPPLARQLLDWNLKCLIVFTLLYRIGF